MNLAEILHKIVDDLNAGNDCDLCWRFVFGGRADYLNLAKLDCDDACCVTVGVLRNTFTTGFKRGEFADELYRDWNIQLFVGIPSRLDIQFYNEVDQDSTCDSKWSKYLHPILCCLDGMEKTICGLHNCNGCESTIEVWKWDAQMKLNYLDNNYDGWLIDATFREGKV